jgi:hypothetical protein
MKSNLKVLLLFLLLLIFVQSNLAFGQLGFKGGLVVSGFQPSQDLSPFSGNDYRPFLGYEVYWIQDDAAYPDIGLQFGIFYTKDISTYFALQPELLYSQRGLHFFQTELYNTSYSLNVNYLEIPVLIKYKIPVRWRVKPGLLAGPYIAVKLSAKRTLEIWDERNTKGVSSIKNLDYGLVFAIHSDFSAWSRQLVIEFRFNWGLANIMSQPEEFTEIFEDAGSVKVLAFTFMIGFVI